MSASLPPPPVPSAPDSARSGRLVALIVAVAVISVLGAGTASWLLARTIRPVTASSASPPADLARQEGSEAGYPPSWNRFETTDGLFSVVAPHDLFFTIPTDLPSGRQEWTAAMHGVRYGVITDRRPLWFGPEHLRGFALQIWDHQGAVIEQGPVTNGELAGYRIVVSRDGWVDHYRVFVAGDRVFLPYVVTRNVGQHADAAERFLSSLSIAT